MLPDQEQGVAHLQVLGQLRGHAQAGVAHHRTPDDADLPARGPGPQGEVGLLAVGEVALVEQADLVQAGPPGQHQGAVGMVGRLPARPGLRPELDAAEVGVDDGAQGLAELGAGQPGPGPAPGGLDHALEASRLGEGVVGGDDGPVPPPRSQPVGQAHVGRGAEAPVVAQADDLGVGGKAGDQGLDGLGAGPVVDHGQAEGDALVQEGLSRPHAAGGLVPVDQDDGELVHPPLRGRRRRRGPDQYRGPVRGMPSIMPSDR